MKQTQMFARAKAMFAAIASLGGLQGLERQAALNDLGPYKSRGHGEGLIGNKHSKRTVAQDKRAATKARNKAKQNLFR